MSLSTEAVIALVTLLVMCLCIPGLWSLIRRQRLFRRASKISFFYFEDTDGFENENLFHELEDATLTLFRNNRSSATELPLHSRLDLPGPPPRRLGAGRSFFIRRTVSSLSELFDNCLISSNKLSADFFFFCAYLQSQVQVYEMYAAPSWFESITSVPEER